MTKLLPALKGRKVSDVFLEYVEPYIRSYFDDTHEQPSLQTLDDILKVPWMIWNSIVLNQTGASELACLASIRLMTRRMPQPVKDILQFMVDRKKKLYADYYYLLGDYKVYREPRTQEIRFRMEARTPPKASKEG